MTVAVTASPDPLRTLVIEQERTPLEALTRVIDAEPGLTCVGAGRSLQIAEDLGPRDVDVVLLGAQVPGIDVVAATRTLRCRFPRARVVVLAGYVDDEFSVAASGAGANAVLATCSSLEDVLQVLRTGAIPTAPGRTSQSRGRDRVSGRLAEARGITARQYQVLRLLAKGHSADQVARSLQINVATSRDHIKALHRVLGCSSTTEMLVAGAQLGLLPELSRPYR